MYGSGTERGDTLVQSYLACIFGRPGGTEENQNARKVVTASVNLGGVTISAVIDSGATRSLVAQDIATKVIEASQ